MTIFTHGDIRSIQKTSKAIVDAAGLPMTIIFIVLDPSNYRLMENLIISTNMQQPPEVVQDNLIGASMSSDNTHIVQLDDFLNESDSLLLQRKLLAKLPDQVPAYFTSKGVDPQPFTAQKK